jgi:PAS domain-containing protein
MEFNLEEAIRIANELVCKKTSRNLTDVEIILLKGAWNREEYDTIAARNQYSTSYLSQDIAPKLWRLLTEILAEKVKKSNFKEALKRHWHEQIASKQTFLDREFVSPPVSSQICIYEFEEKRSPQKSNKLKSRSFSVCDFYVERSDLESICCEIFLQPGSLLRLKGSRLLGKTSLMNKVLAQMRSNGYAVVNLSLKLADKNTHFTNIDRLLRWFCSNLSQELKFPNQLNDYWDEENLGSKVSCTIYIQEYLLAQIDPPLVVCIDDVDLLFPYPEICEDFLALLHSWYEKARTQKCWQKLRLAIVHATDGCLGFNSDRSLLNAFNVGLLLELPEFSYEQTQELATKHKLELSKAELKSLIDLVGGHPYFLQQAFARLRSDCQLTMKEILAKASTESGIYSNYLRQSWIDLHQNSQLAAAFQELVLSPNPLSLDLIQTYQLQNIGLIKLSENQAEPRCKLYRQFFAEHFKNEYWLQARDFDKSYSISYETNLAKFAEMTEAQQNSFLNMLPELIVAANLNDRNETNVKCKLTGQKLTLQMLQLILDIIPKRIFWKDKNSQFLGCNKLFALDAGLEFPKQIVGKNDFELAWQESASLYRADDLVVMQNNIPRINYEELQLREDGTTLLLKTSKVPLRNQKNEVIGVFGCYWCLE